MRKSKSLFFVTLLVYLFLIGPLVVIMAASFSDTTYLKFPGEGFTLRWYHQILQVKSFGSAAKNSIIIAFAGTFVALLFGLPAAYALNRYRFRGKELIKSLFLSPVLIPVIQQIGMNPIQFGIVLLCNLAIGMCTPPVGATLFAGCAVGKIPMEKCMRGIVPFYAAMVVVLLLVTYVPAVSLFLPNLLMGA